MVTASGRECFAISNGSTGSSSSVESTEDCLATVLAMASGNGQWSASEGIVVQTPSGSVLGNP